MATSDIMNTFIFFACLVWLIGGFAWYMTHDSYSTADILRADFDDMLTPDELKIGHKNKQPDSEAGVIDIVDYTIE